MVWTGASTFRFRRSLADPLSNVLMPETAKVALKIDETPGAVRWPGPALGEHTAAVLAEKLGLDEARLSALKSSGVV